MASGRKSCYFVGYHGEKNARPVLLPVGDLQEQWPTCTLMLLAKRKGDDEAYLADCTVSGNELVWMPRAFDTDVIGSGSIQIVAVDTSKSIVGKSEAMMTKVSPALNEEEAEEPEDDPENPYIEQLGDLVTQINTAKTAITQIKTETEAIRQRASNSELQAGLSASAAANSAKSAKDSSDSASSNASAVQRYAESAYNNMATSTVKATSAAASATNASTFAQLALAARDEVIELIAQFKAEYGG